MIELLNYHFMRLIIIFLLFALSSCKMILLNAMLKDPKVETKSSIRSFLKSNDFSDENIYILKGDTSYSKVLENLMNGMIQDYYVFDKTGIQLCYNGSSSCSGVHFKNLLHQGLDSFELCKEDPESLDHILASIIPLDGTSSKMSNLPQSDLYVAIYWQKFMGGKKEYASSVDWMENEAKKFQNKKITFIKINADMQEEWGLTAGKKAKLRWRKKGHNVSMELINLPKS